MNLVATLGASALLTALAASLFAVGAAVVGQRLARPALIAAARRAIVVTAALTTLAMGVVAYALLTGDVTGRGRGLASRRLLLHRDVVVGLRGDLRQVGDAEHLAPIRQFAQAAAHDASDPGADTRVHFVEDQGGNSRVAAGGCLDREADS